MANTLRSNELILNGIEKIKDKIFKDIKEINSPNIKRCKENEEKAELKRIVVPRVEVFMKQFERIRPDKKIGMLKDLSKWLDHKKETVKSLSKSKENALQMRLKSSNKIVNLKANPEVKNKSTKQKREVLSPLIKE